MTILWGILDFPLVIQKHQDFRSLDVWGKELWQQFGFVMSWNRLLEKNQEMNVMDNPIDVRSIYWSGLQHFINTGIKFVVHKRITIRQTLISPFWRPQNGLSFKSAGHGVELSQNYEQCLTGFSAYKFKYHPAGSTDIRIMIILNIKLGQAT